MKKLFSVNTCFYACAIRFLETLASKKFDINRDLDSLIIFIEREYNIFIAQNYSFFNNQKEFYEEIIKYARYLEDRSGNKCAVDDEEELNCIAFEVFRQNIIEILLEQEWNKSSSKM